MFFFLLQIQDLQYTLQNSDLLKHFLTNIVNYNVIRQL